jgi:hypothetical protein
MRCSRHFAALSNRGHRGSEVESDNSQRPKWTWAVLVTLAEATNVVASMRRTRIRHAKLPRTLEFTASTFSHLEL